MSGRRVWTLGLVLVLALSAVLPAQAEERVVVKFSGPLELAELLQELQTTLGLPLVWDPKSRGIQNRQILGDLRFEGTRGEILDAVRSMIMFYELVIIPVGRGGNERLMVMDARATASITKLKPLYVEVTDANVNALAEKDGLFVTTTIPTKNLDDLRDARNALNRIVTGQNIGNVTEIPAARSFVVTDFAPNVASIYRLLKRMDAPSSVDAGKEVVFRAFPLKHAPATGTTATLVQHFDTGSPQKTPGYRGPPQNAVSSVPALPPLRIHADARLNQVLVSGTSQAVDEVAAVIATLDRPLPQSKTSLQYVRLAHQDAAHIAGVLTSIIAGSPSLWVEGPRGTVRPAVVTHADGNALVIHAGEPVLTSLRRLIAEMDTPAPSEEAGEAK